MNTRTVETTQYVTNEKAWAIGRDVPFRMGRGTRFHIRRIVWGRLLAKQEARFGETVKRVVVLVTGK